MAFVALSMAKEGWDDYRRYKLDKLENRTNAWVLDPNGSISNSTKSSKTEDLRKHFRRKRSDNTADAREMGEVTQRPEENPPWSQGEDIRWSRIQWQDIRVGDIVKLHRDDNVPADMILLHATGPNGIAYIETMALDGETNLKSKQACPLFAKHCSSLSALQACDAEVVSEDPNLDLYNYEGKAVVNGEAMPLTLNQVVYRGSTLRNTNSAVGVVINTGEECKIRMNASKNVHAKAPAMQARVNRIVILLVFFVVILSLGCSVGNIFWVRQTQRFAWYLEGESVPFGQVLIAFVIAFNTLIPLSLYVSLEIVKIGQVMLLRDIDMYDPVSNTPMVANTTTILENLGQVSYVFSDKTGTLTENLMRFRKMSVAGTAWLHDMDARRDVDAARRREEVQMSGGNSDDSGKGKHLARTSTNDTQSGHIEDAYVDEPGAPRRSGSIWTSTARPDHSQTELKTDDLIRYIRSKPNSAFSKKARQFILCIALCHTCLPERKPNGQIDFQAASPDELALVEAAQDLGVLLVDRPAQSIKLHFTTQDGPPTEETYQVLDVIEFSSKRKRMSIVIRLPDGRICVFTKGADSVILPRLKQAKLALETASVVDRRASLRKSMEQEKALLRKLSMQHQSPRNSMATSLHHRAGIFGRKSGAGGKRSGSTKRPSFMTAREALGRESWADEPRASAAVARGRSIEMLASPVSMEELSLDSMVDEAVAVSDSAVFERCFQHIDDFASEGLRTLLFAYRYVDEAEYTQWKELYHEATTSLVNRQERIEEAAEQLEQQFDLAGATAIEDKLQQGVPETIDKLRRANIKVWMLTGDKRETAINIAHSARICKPFSEIYILDATATESGSIQEKIAATLVDVGRGMVPHSVVVIDGHTLSVVEDDDILKTLFFDLVARVDSVICCRASPAQKATLVKCIRDHVPASLTLAIGDGANDIAMIQASHVGIGISGREGLQAARISDYAIAQFRFLQKLLFVHGRWNYIRTAKYILGTFWKEIMFYLMQALYQRYNGYTGTSLYESTSLAVFNTLFTSLAVILLGIFEQDLRAETLLAWPELYMYGQRSGAFNMRKYIGWTLTGVVEAVLVFFGIWALFRHIPSNGDDGLFAMGDLAFSAAVILINIKLLVLELHNKTAVTFLGFFISVAGWWLWNVFLAAIFSRKPGPYTVRDGLFENFGRNPVWWLGLVMVLAVVVVGELSVTAVRRVFWPVDGDLMQEIEQMAKKDRKRMLKGQLIEDNDDDGLAELGEARRGLVGALSGRLGRWGGRRASKTVSGDVYMAPFVATPDERSVNPLEAAGEEPAPKKKATTTTSVNEVQPSDEDGAVGSSSSSRAAWGQMMSGAGESDSGIVQSPIEMEPRNVGRYTD